MIDADAGNSRKVLVFQWFHAILTYQIFKDFDARSYTRIQLRASVR